MLLLETIPVPNRAFFVSAAALGAPLFRAAGAAFGGALGVGALGCALGALQQRSQTLKLLENWESKLEATDRIWKYLNVSDGKASLPNLLPLELSWALDCWSRKETSWLGMDVLLPVRLKKADHETTIIVTRPHEFTAKQRCFAWLFGPMKERSLWFSCDVSYSFWCFRFLMPLIWLFRVQEGKHLWFISLGTLCKCGLAVCGNDFVLELGLDLRSQGNVIPSYPGIYKFKRMRLQANCI